MPNTWLIAQCMARLPRRTYFSHPESSLDDFFSGEERGVINSNHRGDGSSPTEQGSEPAAHEIRFLRSLRQSLGIRNQSPSEDGKASETSFSCYRGPSGLSDRLGCRFIATPAGEPASSQVLCVIRDRALSAGTSRIPAPPSATPFLVSHPPVHPASVDSKAPTILSGPHVASCTRDTSEGARPRVGPPHSTSRHQCKWEVCGEWIEGGSKEMWAHVRTWHGLKGHYGDRCRCKWGGCSETLNVSSLPRHLDKHLDIKWCCSNCDAIFARHDCVRKHIRESKECHGAEVVNAAPSLASERASGTSTEQAVAGASSTPWN